MVLEDADVCITRDRTGLKDRREVRTAAEAMGLDINELVFYRCPNASFKAGVIATAPRIRVGIVVPTNVPDDKLLAPLIHEMAHAYQYQAIPDPEALRARYGIAKLELGADYATGFLIRHALGSLDRASFQRNMRLIGDYDKMATEWHGCPENRVAAFRTGFYLRDAPEGFPAAYQKFDNELFDDILKLCEFF